MMDEMEWFKFYCKSCGEVFLRVKTGGAFSFGAHKVLLLVVCSVCLNENEVAIEI